MQRTKFETANWDHVYTLLLELAERIKKSGFKPEIIVGVSRGGWFPARVMSDLLDNSNLANVRVEFYINVYETTREPVITQQVSVSVKDKCVLVVDDVADSGRSLRLVCEELLKDAREVRTVTLYHKPWSCFKPDFYARETDAWIIFPWEYRETVKKLGERMLNEGRSLREVEQELTGIGLKTLLVKRFVKEIFGEV